MSMAKMAKLGVARELQDSPNPDHKPGPDVENDSYTDRVVAFIPSEVVAIYIALLGIFTPDSLAIRWSLFAVGLAFVPVFHWLNFTLSRRRTIPAPPRKPRVFLLLMLLAALAYVGWAAALPSTPFVQFTDQATQVGAAAVLILGFLLPQLADVLSVTPGSTDGGSPPPGAATAQTAAPRRDRAAARSQARPPARPRAGATPHSRARATDHAQG